MKIISQKHLKSFDAGGRISAADMQARKKWSEAVLIGLTILVLILMISRCFWQFDFDDGYITYRIAENISSGAGWVYNSGVKVNGATSVLWTGLLALGSLLFGNAAGAAHWLSGFLAIIAALLLWRLFREDLSLTASSMGLLLIVTQPLLWISLGLETHLLLACAVAAFWFDHLDRELALGLALGALILTRPDGAVLAALLLARRTSSTGSMAWRSIAMMGLLVLPWLLFSWSYFGTVLPNTLAAKMAQGRSGAWSVAMPWPFSSLPIFLTGLIDWWRNVYGLAGAVGLMILTLAPGPRRSRMLCLVVIWSILHLAAYAWLNVPNYHWYYLPVILAFGVTVGDGIERCRRWQQTTLRRIGLSFSALVLAWVIYLHGHFVWSVCQQPLASRERAYRTVGLWLRANAKPDAPLAAMEIGSIGYFSHLHMIDMTGIIDREGPAQVAKGNLGWWFEQRRPDLVLVHDPMAHFERAAVEYPELVQQYRVWKAFRFQDYGNLVVFRHKAFKVRPARKP